jgi:hypothetical protein
MERRRCLKVSEGLWHTAIDRQNERYMGKRSVSNTEIERIEQPNNKFRNYFGGVSSKM